MNYYKSYEYNDKYLYNNKSEIQIDDNNKRNNGDNILDLISIYNEINQSEKKGR